MDPLARKPVKFGAILPLSRGNQFEYFPLKKGCFFSHEAGCHLEWVSSVGGHRIDIYKPDELEQPYRLYLDSSMTEGQDDLIRKVLKEARAGIVTLLPGKRVPVNSQRYPAEMDMGRKLYNRLVYVTGGDIRLAKTKLEQRVPVRPEWWG